MLAAVKVILESMTLSCLFGNRLQFQSSNAVFDCDVCDFRMEREQVHQVEEYASMVIQVPRRLICSGTFPSWCLTAHLILIGPRSLADSEVNDGMHGVGRKRKPGNRNNLIILRGSPPTIHRDHCSSYITRRFRSQKDSDSLNLFEFSPSLKAVAPTMNFMPSSVLAIFSFIGVRKGPGQIALTVIPVPASSELRALVS